jgi:hypothetical protein
VPLQFVGEYQQIGDWMTARTTSDGLDGERSGLWSEFKRIIREVRPRRVEVENSPRLLVLGSAGPEFLETWPNWGSMRDGECWELPDVGAPHERDRLWIVPTPVASMSKGSSPGALTRKSGREPGARPAGPLRDGYRRWPAQPGVRRVADGVAHRADRLKAIGNGQVPAVAATAWSLLGRVVLVAGFPPCTDVAVSGSRWFAAKGAKDKHFQTRAALVAEQCRMVGMACGCPWLFENPVSVFSSIFGKPDHVFHPHQYTQLCAEDNYTKTTCLWTGGGFRMPAPCPDLTLGPPDDRIHKCPPSEERANIRSASPRGFCEALYEANAPHLRGRLLEAA